MQRVWGQWRLAALKLQPTQRRLGHSRGLGLGVQHKHCSALLSTSKFPGSSGTGQTDVQRCWSTLH